MSPALFLILAFSLFTRNSLCEVAILNDLINVVQSKTANDHQQSMLVLSRDASTAETITLQDRKLEISGNDTATIGSVTESREGPLFHADNSVLGLFHMAILAPKNSQISCLSNASSLVVDTVQLLGNMRFNQAFSLQTSSASFHALSLPAGPLHSLFGSDSVKSKISVENSSFSTLCLVDNAPLFCADQIELTNVAFENISTIKRSRSDVVVSDVKVTDCSFHQVYSPFAGVIVPGSHARSFTSINNIYSSNKEYTETQDITDEEASFDGDTFKNIVGKTGAIVFSGNTLTVNKCTFENCRGEEYSGAIQSCGDSTVDITDTVFKNCSTYKIGGAVNFDGKSITITGCNVTLCSANDPVSLNFYSRCGGFYLKGTEQVSVSSVHFTDCSADIAGALAVWSDKSVKISSSLFESCTARRTGASIVLGSDDMMESGAIYNLEKEVPKYLSAHKDQYFDLFMQFLGAPPLVSWYKQAIPQLDKDVIGELLTLPLTDHWRDEVISYLKTHKSKWIDAILDTVLNSTRFGSLVQTLDSYDSSFLPGYVTPSNLIKAFLPPFLHDNYFQLVKTPVDFKFLTFIDQLIQQILSDDFLSEYNKYPKDNAQGYVLAFLKPLLSEESFTEVESQLKDSMLKIPGALVALFNYIMREVTPEELVDDPSILLNEKFLGDFTLDILHYLEDTNRPLNDWLKPLLHRVTNSKYDDIINCTFASDFNAEKLIISILKVVSTEDVRTFASELLQRINEDDVLGILKNSTQFASTPEIAEFFKSLSDEDNFVQKILTHFLNEDFLRIFEDGESTPFFYFLSEDIPRYIKHKVHDLFPELKYSSLLQSFTLQRHNSVEQILKSDSTTNDTDESPEEPEPAPEPTPAPSPDTPTPSPDTPTPEPVSPAPEPDTPPEPYPPYPDPDPPYPEPGRKQVTGYYGIFSCSYDYYDHDYEDPHDIVMGNVTRLLFETFCIQDIVDACHTFKRSERASRDLSNLLEEVIDVVFKTYFKGTYAESLFLFFHSGKKDDIYQLMDRGASRALYYAFNSAFKEAEKEQEEETYDHHSYGVDETAVIAKTFKFSLNPAIQDSFGLLIEEWFGVGSDSDDDHPYPPYYDGDEQPDQPADPDTRTNKFWEFLTVTLSDNILKFFDMEAIDIFTELRDYLKEHATELSSVDGMAKYCLSDTMYKRFSKYNDKTVPGAIVSLCSIMLNDDFISNIQKNIKGVTSNYHIPLLKSIVSEKLYPFIDALNKPTFSSVLDALLNVTFSKESITLFRQHLEAYPGDYITAFLKPVLHPDLYKKLDSFKYSPAPRLSALASRIYDRDLINVLWKNFQTDVNTYVSSHDCWFGDGDRPDEPQSRRNADLPTITIEKCGFIESTNAGQWESSGLDVYSPTQTESSSDQPTEPTFNLDITSCYTTADSKESLGVPKETPVEGEVKYSADPADDSGSGIKPDKDHPLPPLPGPGGDDTPTTDETSDDGDTDDGKGTNASNTPRKNNSSLIIIIVVGSLTAVVAIVAIITACVCFRRQKTSKANVEMDGYYTSM